MRILGIETSCDETAAAVVENGTVVLSSVIASQIALHQITGGVVPEVAAREHVLKIIPVIKAALSPSDGGAKALLSNILNMAGKSAKAGASARAQIASARPAAPGAPAASLMQSIDAIAVTRGPGLLSSLVIGTTAASTLATYFNKPLIPVNHIAGHIYANWLDEKPADPIQFPIIILTVSGGHNELVLMRSHAQFQLLGETLDDAAGEAFDKVARLLNLGYPGGPAIAKAAEGILPAADLSPRAPRGFGTTAPASGTYAAAVPVRTVDANRIVFPRAYLSADSFDFSFSGLKTAVLNLVQQEYKKQLAPAVASSAPPAPPSLSPQFIADCAASFQDSVCQILSDKLLRAAEKYKVKEVHLAGGVSANKHLRAVVAKKIEEKYYLDQNNRRIKISVSPRLRYPQKIAYCTDNAAMIAAAAFFLRSKTPHSAPAPRAVSSGRASPRASGKSAARSNTSVTPAGLLEQSGAVIFPPPNTPFLADPGLNLYDTHES
jgi:N6-L-threonylcarbamoyladenine synthase